MSQKESSEKIRQNNSSNHQSEKRTSKSLDKNVGLQKTSPAKRFVTTVKVFMTEEERDSILEKAYEYGGISNYIRHHLGLGLNMPGRKKKNPPPAIELDFLDD